MNQEEILATEINSRLQRLKNQKAAVELLKKYELLEAKIILTDECWDSESGLPRFTQDLYDEAIQLQSERNKILEVFQNP